MNPPSFPPDARPTTMERERTPGEGGGVRAFHGRTWVHVALLACTAVTVSFVGWIMEGGEADLSSWAGTVGSLRDFASSEAVSCPMPSVSMLYRQLKFLDARNLAESDSST